jgi:SAM-dependent methyltransferase
MTMRLSCPICGYEADHFRPAGIKPRPDAMCPSCGSYERHRGLWLFLRERTSVLSGGIRILHFAPELCFQERFRALPGVTYIDADPYSPVASLRFPMNAIPFPDGAFDFVLASHVLEHIADEQGALREVSRVLAPDGFAVLQVPIIRQGPTFEDRRIKRPETRLRVYLHPDHVRAYGTDYPERLKAAGLRVTVDGFLRKLSDETKRRHKLSIEDIHVCRK